MAKKKRPSSEWQKPPKSAHALAAAETVRNWRPRPPLPQRRLIYTLLGMALLCFGIFLAFWIPSQSLVSDLRDRGVTTTATVTAVDNKPEYVKVRFNGPAGSTTAELHDYAGMRPNAAVGEVLRVRYDSEDPSRVLPVNWVDNPPIANLPMIGTAALTLFFLAGTVVLVLRRRWVLRTFGPSPATADSDSPDAERGGKPVRLSKPSSSA